MALFAMPLVRRCPSVLWMALKLLVTGDARSGLAAAFREPLSVEIAAAIGLTCGHGQHGCSIADAAGGRALTEIA